MPLFLVFALFLSVANTSARPILDVQKSDANGLVFEVHLPAHPSTPFGLTRADSTQPPVLSRLVAAPLGAELDVQIEEAEYAEFDRTDETSVYPVDLITTRYLGSLRGVPTHALSLAPYQYDAQRDKLRVYTRLRATVRFVGGRRAKAAAPASHSSYTAFLNPAQAPQFARTTPRAKAAQADWYDSEYPWIKIAVAKDGLYRINRSWLEQFVSAEAIDPQTLRLFYLGQEQLLYASGEEDRRFDEDDFLLFYGQYRRGDRDHESIYGSENTYWLTWGGARGLRYAERSAAPHSDYPQTNSFWHLAHFERDMIFDALASAPDKDRDHWFWTLNNKPLTATKADVPSAAEFPGNLIYPDLDKTYKAQVRVALHGASDLGHHTVLKLNAREVLADTVWGGAGEGMVEFISQTEVDGSLLKDGRNRILLQVFADQAKFDLMWFNWFEIGYYRRYLPTLGYLEATHPSSQGHRIVVQRFTHPDIEIFDLNSGTRLVDFAVEEDVEQTDAELFMATFEDSGEREAHYIMADSSAIIIPTGALDTPSSWRAFSGADYLIIAHPLLMDAAHRLAAHRRSSGLSTAAISSEDIYDEFNYGRMDAEAIAAFIQHAYDRWPQRPSYIVLLGDETWDYRNIIGGGWPNVVPSRYYQSRGRGLAPSDFLYALVDGDDLLPDLSIGRLTASSPESAEAIVDKVISYDTPVSGPWRTRALFLANYHAKNIFSEPSDSLIARYVQPAGLQPVRVYNPDESPIPNTAGRAFVDALNEGALLVNFNGHGSPGTMQSLFTLSLPDWGYMSQVQNGPRLPLVLALSCLNGLFANPVVQGLAETFTTSSNGGAIAYISASAKSFVAQNDLLSDRFYAALFAQQSAPFGSALDAAKAQVLAAHPSWIDAALTMQLVGDPAQRIALPAAPDYAATALELDADPVRGHSAIEISARLVNYGRPGADSLRIDLIAYSDTSATVDTLQRVVEPPFSGERTLSFVWPTGARRGPWHLALHIDGLDEIAELDETNNAIEQSVDILGPLVATPLFPADHAALAADEVLLEAIVPQGLARYTCEFELATAMDFSDAVRSPLVEAQDRVAAYRPALVGDTTYFWRVRLHADGTPGIWSDTRSLQSTAGPTWSQSTVQLLRDAGTAFELRDHVVALSSLPLPLRPDSTTREDGFTVRDHAGSGVLVTDGTWLYAKRWYNDASTVYPGTDYFTRIGTGLNETFRSGNFGAFGDSTTAGISATYHSDGYIYNESGKAFELERLSLQNGALDTVAVPDGLLEWKFGRVEDGHSLITSDGTFIYNVSMSTAQGARNGWSVRVFDPAQSWTLVREFTSPPTENGFTFEWTDGILADGTYLYFIEWQGQRRIRMVDATDGTFIDEWQSDQDVTRIITGQYDWVNNKVWLGDLLSSAVFRYTGSQRVREGALVSQPIGPAAQWKTLEVEGRDIRVALEALNAQGQWQTLAGWGKLTPGKHDLSTLDAGAYPRLRLRADFASTEAALARWQLDFSRLPSLQIVRAEGRDHAGGLRIEVTALNRSDQPIDDAVIRLEQSGKSTPLRQVSLPTLARGQSHTIQIDSLALPTRGAQLFAEVFSGRPDADPEDNRRAVALFIEGLLPIDIAVWPEDRPFLSGDPLRADQGLLLSFSDAPDAEITVRIDGQFVAPDSLIEAYPAPPRRLFRPALTPGQHQLEAQLVRGDETLGTTRTTFYLDDALRVRNALLYPHPVRAETHFTYVLSQSAQVEIEVFSLAGKLVKRLGPYDQAAGFAQVAWDGRSSGGDLLANGTYLYRLVARNEAGGDAVFRGALVLAR